MDARESGIETWTERAARLLRAAHAAAEAGDAEEALTVANEAVESLRVELGDAEPPEGVQARYADDA